MRCSGSRSAERRREDRDHRDADPLQISNQHGYSCFVLRHAIRARFHGREPRMARAALCDTVRAADGWTVIGDGLAPGGNAARAAGTGRRIHVRKRRVATPETRIIRRMMLDSDSCYRALTAHDARFDGRFFVGVRSTRIYCRPVCNVRLPRRENCRFFRERGRGRSRGLPALPALPPGARAGLRERRRVGAASRRPPSS